jgi:hypothetical protein
MHRARKDTYSLNYHYQISEGMKKTNYLTLKKNPKKNS